MALLLCMLLAACPSAARAGESELNHNLPLMVGVDTVRETRIDDTVIGIGTVAAWRELPISSEASGLAVVEVAADEGDSVQKDQVLVRLNPVMVLAQVEQSKAAVAEAEASLANALSDQKRAHAVNSGVLSKQTVEQRETLVKTATAKLAAAQALLSEANVRLAQTVIMAPAGGIVSTRSATLGQIVQSGTELFRIIQDSRLEVNALVGEADILKIRSRQSARIVDAVGRTWTGSVRSVAPVIDQTSRQGTVRLAFGQSTDLKPGMFVRVEVETGGDMALTVPLGALVWREGGTAVFTVSEDGTASVRPIEVGRKTSTVVEALRGLAAGDKIVVEGAGLLNDGEKVRTNLASVQLPGTTP